MYSGLLIVENDVEVPDSHRVALRQKAGQITRPQIQLDAEILRRATAILHEFRELLVRADVVLTLLFLENFKHGHVLFDEGRILLAELSDLEECLPAESQELKDVEHEHSIAPNQLS